MVAGLCGIAFCAVIWWTSLDWWWERWETGETKNSIWAPRLWIPSLSLPIGFGLLALQYVVELWKAFVRHEVAPEVVPGEEIHGA